MAQRPANGKRALERISGSGEHDVDDSGDEGEGSGSSIKHRWMFGDFTVLYRMPHVWVYYRRSVLIYSGELDARGKIRTGSYNDYMPVHISRRAVRREARRLLREKPWAGLC